MKYEVRIKPEVKPLICPGGGGDEIHFQHTDVQKCKKRLLNMQFKHFNFVVKVNFSFYRSIFLSFSSSVKKTGTLPPPPSKQYFAVCAHIDMGKQKAVLHTSNAIRANAVAL